jgi:N-acetylglucosaminyl-diphospho-decaprenol L-rhamnosyltransferase
MSAADPSLTSIVVVSYHTGPVLFDAIKSILAQTEPVELLLVDNGNTADVLSRLQAIAMQDKRMQLITGHGNVGFSKGCNRGARDARGDYLLFLNPDSTIPPDAVARLKEHAAKVARPFMFGARLVDRHGLDQRGCRRALLTPASAFVEALHLGALFPVMRLNRHRETVPVQLSPMPAISGAFMFLRREDFCSVQGFDEGYFLHVDDLDLCWRFRRAGGEIYFVPDVVVTHYGGTSKASRVFIERHKARGFVRYFHKNFGETYPKPFLWLLDGAIWLRLWLRLSRYALRPPNRVL